MRTCVHCVLARALAAEAAALSRAGLAVHVRSTVPVSLPRAAGGVYRELRGFLREAAAGVRGGIVRVCLVDLPGRWCIEVLAAVPDGRGTRVLSRVFPRHADGTLEGGFLEGVLA
jgi:hypothetical protein